MSYQRGPLFRTLKSVAICWWLLTECELLEPWWQESNRIGSLPKMAGEYEGAQRNTNFGWHWWCPLLSSSCCYPGVSLHFVMPFFPVVGTVDTTFCHSIVCNVLSISVWVKKNSELRVKVLDPKLSVTYSAELVACKKNLYDPALLFQLVWYACKWSTKTCSEWCWDVVWCLVMRSLYD
jgi:hypothetical protein